MFANPDSSGKVEFVLRGVWGCRLDESTASQLVLHASLTSHSALVNPSGSIHLRASTMSELHDWNSNEFLGFNLKLLGKKSKKSVLVSAGKLSDKEKMLPALQKLAKLNVELSATPGTYRFL